MTNRENLKLAEKLIAAALYGRNADRVVERAEKFDQYFWGDHPIRKRSKSMGNKVYNKFSEIIENKLARLTDALPKWHFRGQEESDLITAKIANKAIGDIIWDHLSWDEKAEDALLECMAAGSVHLKLGIDQFGWPVIQIIPCEQIAVHPQARNFDELSYVVFFFSKRIEQIKELYRVTLAYEPEKSSSTIPKASEILSQNNPYKISSNIWDYMNQNTRRRSMIDSDVMPTAIIAEIWMNDLTREVIPFEKSETDEENNKLSQLQNVEPSLDENHPKHIQEHENYLASLDPTVDADIINALKLHIEKHRTFPLTTTRLKYPHGRILTVSQNKLLRDEPFPLGLHWKKFLIKFDWIKSRRHYWGKPVALDLFDRQDAYNHRKNSITANTNLLNVGIRKIKKGTFKDTKNMTNLIGQNIPVNHRDDIEIDFGKPLPAHFFTDLAIEEQGMERQAGEESALVGRLPAPGVAGVTIEQLIQQGLIRGGLPMRHYLAALKKLAKTILHIIVEFEPQGFYIEIDNQKYSPSVLAGMISEQNIRIDVKINMTSRESDFREAIELFKANIYDRMAVLQRLDDPKKYEIIQRLNEVEQLKSIVEELAKQKEILVKQINTIRNREQGKQGEGNVGAI